MPIGPMGEPLPYNGPAGPPMGGPMPGAMPGGGPQDEVGQLLALRDQIDQRLAELMGGAGMPQVAGGVPAPMPMDAAMPPGLLA